jgi:hypothetical protein
MAPVVSSATQYALEIDRAMAQMVSRRRLTEEVTVRPQANPVRIRGVQRVTTTNFFPTTSVVPCQSRSTNAAYTVLYLSHML